MDEIRTALATPLNNDNGHLLREQLADIERWQAYVSAKYRAAEVELADLRGKLYNPSLSSADARKIDVERATRAQQQTVDELADIAKCIKDRISLGQSFLRSMMAEIEGGLR